MQIKLLQQFHPHLSLYQYNEIPVLKLQHAIGSAEIALQGAQLLSWKPTSVSQDLFWLSEIEPFKLGNAIRGGVPICYPWFGNINTPAHGYARNQLWQLHHYDILSDQVKLSFLLYHPLAHNQQNPLQAKLEIIFTQDCEFRFTHYDNQPAQLAFHSYFNISHITQISVTNLPSICFNSLTGQQENTPTTRQINGNVDCIYEAQSPTIIEDPNYQRIIRVEHQNNRNIVLWNPWHKTTSAMSETGYQAMVCVESANINQPLQKDDVIYVKIKAQPY